MVAGKDKAEEKLRPRDPSIIVIYQCTNIGGTVPPQDIEPEFTTQDMCDGLGGAGGGTGVGGGLPTCGETGATCEDNYDCCAGLLCSLNVCD